MYQTEYFSFLETDHCTGCLLNLSCTINPTYTPTTTIESPTLSCGKCICCYEPVLPRKDLTFIFDSLDSQVVLVHTCDPISTEKLHDEICKKTKAFITREGNILKIGIRNRTHAVTQLILEVVKEMATCKEEENGRDCERPAEV